MKNFKVVQDYEDMLEYIDMLQKRNSEQLSFYPESTFRKAKQKNRLYLGLLNGEPCGYIYAGSAKGEDLKIHQACIQYDVRRQRYGEKLVEVIEDWAYKSGCYSVTLRCGFDLLANFFWDNLGYQVIDIQDGGARRMRKINISRKPLSSLSISIFFATLASIKL